jgi:hypothetical protein
MELDFGYSRGHLVYCIDGVTYYADGSIDDESRPCPKCNLVSEPGGPDICLGWIEGASSACCGHGKELGFVMSDRLYTMEEWK